MNYRFLVTDIEWPESSTLDLPGSIAVNLPKWLVEADSIDDDEWDEVINDELESKFGCRADSFSFEPDE